MSAIPVTPSQTVGPFFHDCLLRDDRCEAMVGDEGGAQIRVEGRVIDGDAAPVPDASRGRTHGSATSRDRTSPVAFPATSR